MNNLENKLILNDQILSAIDLILEKCPKTVFGGSIALNAVGLLNREIHDIDVFYCDESLETNGFLKIKRSSIVSDTVTNTNGKEIQRTGVVINDVNTCAFNVGQEELQHSLFRFTRDGKERTICIQNVNYAIQAKISYTSKTSKHKEDINSIDEFMNNLFGI